MTKHVGILSISAATVGAVTAASPAIAQDNNLSSGDTAWMLTSTVIVLMMTIPGVALFYGGMARKKNVPSTVMRGGFLGDAGVLDFAGGTVVHINSGIAALVAAIVLGKRVGFGRENLAPHNVVLTVVGASFLWVRWFGFNGGSAFAANGAAGMAMAVTQIATAAAALAWMFAEWITHRKPSVLGIASGAIAGLVAISPRHRDLSGPAARWPLVTLQA